MFSYPLNMFILFIRPAIFIVNDVYIMEISRLVPKVRIGSFSPPLAMPVSAGRQGKRHILVSRT